VVDADERVKGGASGSIGRLDAGDDGVGMRVVVCIEIE
jgi:hypothetical protein